jgi:hypothetical protein
MTVTVTLEGEGISFERQIDESTALQIMEISLDGGSVRTKPGGESADASEPREEEAVDAGGGLPGNFFTRLSTKQEAFVRVLLEDGGWVSNEEVRERMQDDYGVETSGPQAIAGVRAGFTRKYGDEFNLDQRRWRDELDQNQYRLNPDYIDELEEGLAQLEED